MVHIKSWNKMCIFNIIIHNGLLVSRLETEKKNGLNKLQLCAADRLSQFEN